MKDDDIDKKNFKKRYGRYEFIVVRFGLTNTPTAFMCFMNNIFREYLDMFILVFIDDIMM